MTDRNKIAQELTVEQLDGFVSGLAALPGRERTLAQIKHKAAELGITISLMSAKSFRDTTFDRYLARMQRAQDVAKQVEEIDKGGSTMADASAKMLSRKIFDQIMASDEEDAVDALDMDKTSLAVSRLQRGVRDKSEVERRQSETLAKLREYERREEERAEKKAALQKTIEKEVKRGGISAEARKAIDQELGVL